MSRYIVKKGDTLRVIARDVLNSRIGWQEIANLNQISDPNVLFPGMTLKLPDEVLSQGIYVVQYGDTLSSIAKKSLGDGTRWREIATLNGIYNPDYIYVGQELKLPRDAKINEEDSSSPENEIPSPLVRERSPPSERPATELLARGIFFIVADEIDPFSKKLVRKVIYPENIQNNPQLVKEIIRPDKYGFKPRAPQSNVSIGRHVLGMTDSRYISTSTLPKGSPRFPGDTFYIDVKKLKKSGAKIYDAADIIKDVERIAAKTKDTKYLDYIKDILNKSTNIDKEILVEGNIPAKAVKGSKTMAATKGLKFVAGVGVILSVNDLTHAAIESHEIGSVRPIAEESLRQVGGWGAAFAGAKIGTMTGAALGIETGPGALLTGAAGGLIGGVAGYFGAEWIIDFLAEDDGD